MKRKPIALRILSDRTWIPVICIMLFLGVTSCRKRLYAPSFPTVLSHPPQFDSTHKWIDWNVWFPPTSTDAERTNYINALQQYVMQYISNYDYVNHTTIPFIPQLLHCPCDPLLFNYNITLPIGASGLAANPPKKPGNGVGGSGELVNHNNTFLMDSVNANMYKADSSKKYFKSFTVDNSKVLAIMDTGLDSTKFQDSFSQLLWSPLPGALNLRNFQWFSNGRGYEDCQDDDPYRHGTAVTALALTASESGTSGPFSKPKIMVLKVLDQKRQGTTFTVSCALSYAQQNNATVINASLGYYSQGDVDSILQQYVKLCQSNPQGSIPIIAAAGNIPGVHDNNKLCNPTPNSNSLTNHRLFFPGCFSASTTIKNVICVNGLQKDDLSCYYQNYSSDFVSVGVVNEPHSNFCCQFPVWRLNSFYEGSSFATPVVSGLMIQYLMSAPGNTWQNCLNTISTTNTGPSKRKIIYQISLP